MCHHRTGLQIRLVKTILLFYPFIARVIHVRLGFHSIRMEMVAANHQHILLCTSLTALRLLLNEWHRHAKLIFCLASFLCFARHTNIFKAAGYLVHHSGFSTSGKFSEEDALQKHMSHMGKPMSKSLFVLPSLWRFAAVCHTRSQPGDHEL